MSVEIVGNLRVKVEPSPAFGSQKVLITIRDDEFLVQAPALDVDSATAWIDGVGGESGLRGLFLSCKADASPRSEETCDMPFPHGEHRWGSVDGAEHWCNGRHDKET